MTGYIAGIPNGTDNLSTSQGQMKTNFGVLQTLYAQDHGGWTDATANGLHKKVTFYQVAAPGAQIAPSSTAYTKTLGTTPQQELFFKNSLFETQITSNGNAIWKGSPVGGENGEVLSNITTNGAMLLPNGLAFIWGFKSSTSSDTTISLPGTGFPGWPANGFKNHIYNAQLTVQTSSGSTFRMYVDGLAIDEITTKSSGSCGVYFFCIGD